MSHPKSGQTASQQNLLWASCVRWRAAATLRLFCFPYAGAGGGIYRPWAERMPEDIEVWAVQLPGRERRITEPPISSVPELVKGLSEGLRELLQGNFAFFGHSMGGLLSFELARLLRREQRPGPCCIAISGLGAPPGLLRRQKPISHLPASELIQELHHLNGTPREVLDHPELIELVLPIVRADFKAVETYDFKPEAPLTCPILAYGGTSDTETSPEDIAKWGSQTTSAFTMRLFPGDHFYIHSSAAALTQTLAIDLRSISSGQ